ncbi:hypothetical protein ASF03_13760 [Rhizobium sp. Leaf68]|nr:hypothetical protein ASE62_13080 [Rhizobium sp. Leaf202]KQN84315.1 hypothetical protein ASF03_13760 [Rhizobium sp. Leaf68]
MSILSRYDEVIEAIALRNDVPFSLIKKMIALEELHGNLHAHGARPALRRAVSEIVERALAEKAEE